MRMTKKEMVDGLKLERKNLKQEQRQLENRINLITSKIENIEKILKIYKFSCSSQED